MYCSRCGAEIKNDAGVCVVCGARFANGYGKHARGRKAAVLAAAGVVLAAALLFGMAYYVFFVYPSQQTLAVLRLSETFFNNAYEPQKSAAAAQGKSGGGSAGKGAELVDYFCDVALGVEYGEADGVIKRWEKPILVEVSGEYTGEDLSAIEDHIELLNGLEALPEISIVESGGNFLIYFLPLEEMSDTIPGYVQGNYGFFFLEWYAGYAASAAYIGIASDVTTQEQRNHLILEEFTQSLGLMNDSEEYPDSIFQQRWTETQALSATDIELLRMLYGAGLKPGMDEREVRSALGG